MELRGGDSLLALSEPVFVERWSEHRDFAVLVPHSVRQGDEGDRTKRRLTAVMFVGMAAMAASGLVPVVHAIIGACALLIATRTITFGRTIASVDLDIVLIVAAAIGIGAAISSTGLSIHLAGGLAELAAADPIITVIVVATVLLTELITNVAAVGLMVPIALDLASLTGADPRGLALAVTVAAIVMLVAMTAIR